MCPIDVLGWTIYLKLANVYANKSWNAGDFKHMYKIYL